MSSKNVTAITIVLLSLGAMARAEVMYSVTELGGLGLSDIWGVAINSAGDIAGNLLDHGQRDAFLYKAATGIITDIGTLPGTQNSYGLGINSSDQIVGYSGPFPTESSNMGSTFLYSNGSITELPNLGGYSATATSINDSGQIVGSSKLAPYGNNSVGAFLIGNGSIGNIGSLGPTNETDAFSINSTGEIAGSAYAFLPGGGSVPHAFIYANGTMRDLDPGDYANSSALSVNNKGDATGYVDFEQSPNYYVIEPFVYSNGQMIRIPNSPAASAGFGESINDSDEIVGYMHLNDGDYHALVYQNGILTDLNSLIDPSLGIDLQYADGVNDSGQIVATGNTASGRTAFILTPVSPTTAAPEPCAFALFGCGAAGICVLRKRMTRLR